MHSKDKMKVLFPKILRPRDKEWKGKKLGKKEINCYFSLCNLVYAKLG